MSILQSAVKAGLVLGTLSGVLLGCGKTADPDKNVTYWSSVAPIVNDKCLKCHQAGGVAPLRLDSYEAVKTNAAVIASVTKARTMPPFLVSHDGTCGKIEDAEALTDDQIATLDAWANSELKEGTPVTLELPKVPQLENAISFQTPTLVPKAQGGQLAQYDEYRCFPADDKLSEDAFITGYDVLPGNAALVHHVLAFVVDPARKTPSGKTNAEVMQALDQADPDRVGWPCFGLAGDGVEAESVPVTWAPGQGPMLYPAGIGVPQRKTDKLILQMHYNLVDPRVQGQSDTTEVRIRYANKVDRKAVFLFWDPLLDSLRDKAVVIPPKAASTRLSWTASGAEWGLGQLPYVDLVGVMPHMHVRGKKLQLDMLSGGKDACLSKVDRWDFNWQKFYFYKDPLPRFTANTQLKITCDFDTAADNDPVYPGWGTRNEMCLAVMMLALPPGY